ncbi:MAG: sulfite exporter TauE/SafE family protein [Cellvibrionaceae bacterium]|nr:sulfite exporter TauE/SafE family protein [Cellvibrionaceae bacterium]
MTLEFVAEQLLLLTVAIAANLLSSLAGGGAGLVQLPALIFLGLPFATALATHKIATVALGVGASAKHRKEGHVEMRFAIYILVCGLPGVIVGARTVLGLPEDLARIALGLLTIGLGVYSIFKKNLGQEWRPRNRDLRGMVLGGIWLFALGFLNGSLTSGTGLFVTLLLVGWFGLDYKRATAYTMILVGLFWNGAGALTLVLLMPAQWSWLPMLILGSLIGGYWGAHLAIQKGNPLIKRVFEIVTILSGASLITTVFR